LGKKHNTGHRIARFDVFTAVMFQVDVFWVMTPCSVAVRCQRFGGPCFLLIFWRLIWLPAPWLPQLQTCIEWRIIA